jgi:DNA-directed RNA polymerase specialized sigma subunit
MEESAVTKLDLAEQLSQLPSSGRRVIVGLYLRERTEAELAGELHISQQAVNKWKQKMLNRLSQKPSSWR